MPLTVGSRRALLVPGAVAGLPDPVMAFHGSYTNGSASTAGSITTTSDIAAGSLVAVYGGFNSNRNMTVPSDNVSPGDTWTSFGNYNPDAVNVISGWWKIASAAMAAGTVITITSNASCSKGIQCYSLTNLDTSAPISLKGAGAFATGVTPTASVSPHNANDFIVSHLIIASGTADGAITRDAAFTTANVINSGSVFRLDTSGRTASATSTTKTDTLATSRTWAEYLVAFKKRVA